jgi:CPA1 family monovalent cation:H+ antiporter
MSVFQILAAFLALVGLAGWLNARFLNWPTATVMVIAGGLNAGIFVLIDRWFPHSPAGTLIASVSRLDFPQAVLGYMLAFLLFAGATQVDLRELRRQLWAIWTLATVGVAASTFAVGAGLWLGARLLGLDLSLPWALVFGALISPTDPIAVLAAVKKGKMSKVLEVVLQGEALFNDGVGIVVFTAMVALAASTGSASPWMTVGLIALQALGGLALGAAGAAVVMLAMRSIDDAAVEVILSLALATGVYALAQGVGVSGPIAVVTAGLLIGSETAQKAMSEHPHRHLRTFWTLIDEILNAVLFLLVGLEILVVPFDLRLVGLWLVAIVLVVAVRTLLVLPWGVFFQAHRKQRGAVVVLAWGGLHGALSLAMALSIPHSPSQSVVVSTTFAVVIASIVVQGLTFTRAVAASTAPPKPA